MAKRKGGYTLVLDHAPSVKSWAAVGSKMEGEGPLGKLFDVIREDSHFGESSWEKAESKMQKEALGLALQKGGFSPGEIQYLFAGDLLNQLCGSTFGLRDFGIPFVGLYGACSTMAESLALSALFVDCGLCSLAAAVTSSHFCSAERQFRFPLEYGGLRTPTSQWTATASGAVVLGKQDAPPYVRAVTIGTIKDMGISDANNMGAAMAPAAADTLRKYLEDTGTSPAQYDMILTGDLGLVGSQLMLELLTQEGIDLLGRHHDCGLLLYDTDRQAKGGAGGSGCGCSASVLCARLLPALKNGEFSDILFMATGAMMSTTSSQQGESIPSVAHLLHLSKYKQGGREGC